MTSIEPKRRWPSVVTLLLCAIASASTLYADDPQVDVPPARPLIEGRPLFDSKGCATCHAVWAENGGADPAKLDLGRNGAWRDLMQFSGALWNHASVAADMRAKGVEWQSISPAEMEKLAAYLFYVKFLGKSGNAETGTELFTKRSCAGCHQLGGQGGTVGPRLDELKAYASSFFLAQALWNHGPEMAAKMREHGIARPRLEGDDVAHIVAFLRGDDREVPVELGQAWSGSPAAGKTLLEQRGCTKCHAVHGVGGEVGPDLGLQRPRANVAEMAAGLWNHGPTMWSKMRELGVGFPKLTDREISDILAYLYFLQYTGGGGDTAQGARLYEERSCARCHPLEATSASSLQVPEATRSFLGWAAAMWNHAGAQGSEPGAALSRFAGSEMRDLVSFLESRRTER